MNALFMAKKSSHEHGGTCYSGYTYSMGHESCDNGYRKHTGSSISPRGDSPVTAQKPRMARCLRLPLHHCPHPSRSLRLNSLTAARRACTSCSAYACAVAACACTDAASSKAAPVAAAMASASSSSGQPLLLASRRAAAASLALATKATAASTRSVTSASRPTSSLELASWLGLGLI